MGHFLCALFSSKTYFKGVKKHSKTVAEVFCVPMNHVYMQKLTQGWGRGGGARPVMFKFICLSVGHTP